MYANISFEHLGKIMLPKALECLRGNVAVTSYHMLWKSRHGGAYIRIEERSWRETNQKNRGRKRQKCQGKKVQGRTRGIGGFVGSWAVHALGSEINIMQMPPRWGTCFHWLFKKKKTAFIDGIATKKEVLSIHIRIITEISSLFPATLMFDNHGHLQILDVFIGTEKSSAQMCSSSIFDVKVLCIECIVGCIALLLMYRLASTMPDINFIW